jgi:hypothetical protein
MQFLGPQLDFTTLDHERNTDIRERLRVMCIAGEMQGHHQNWKLIISISIPIQRTGAKRTWKTKTTMEKTKTIMRFMGTDLTLSDPEYTILWQGWQIKRGRRKRREIILRK